MDHPTDGRVLFVGEGNFSLSASLVSSGKLSGPQIIASSLDTRAVVEDAHQRAATNISLLEEAGSTVLFEVDARELHNHPEISFFEFSRIIFNFPLADRHNIKKNRTLLSEFFCSAIRILDRQKGQVMVTLCKGQGGTPADQPMRSWHDSWQVVSMATDAGLILSEVLPFSAADLGSYESVGFRFQDKGFNTDNALIHIFEVAITVRVPESSTGRCFIQQDEEDYAVPAYVRHKLDSWSLLDKENHPVSILHQHLMSSLQSQGPVTVLPSNDSHFLRVLPGYKSTLSVNVILEVDGLQPKTVDPDRDFDTTEVPLVAQASLLADQSSLSKDLKEMKNRACVASAAGDASEKQASDGASNEKGVETSSNMFVHGVDRGGDAWLQGQRSHVEKDEHPAGLFKAVVSASVLRPFMMPVYVVHRISSPQSDPSVDTAAVDDADLKGSEIDVDEPSERGVDPHEPLHSAGAHEDLHLLPAGSMVPSASENSVSVKGGSGKDKNQTVNADQSPVSANTLFHLRCSLMENVPHLLSFMKHTAAKHQSAAMSGIVFRKCPISQHQVPVSHETLLLSQSESATPYELADQLRTALRGVSSCETAENVQVQDTDCKVGIGDCVSATILLTLSAQSSTGFTVLGHVFRLDKSGKVRMEEASAGTVAYSTHLLTATESVLGALLYLDEIAFHFVRLPDARLLWSEEPRFIAQFEKNQSTLLPLPVFQPFSLYPVRFVHDVSFWEDPNRVFDETEFLDVVRDVAYETVVKVTLIDKFENSSTGKMSRCYRLVFQSHDRALSYITSWKLQSMIRLKVAHDLGVLLR